MAVKIRLKRMGKKKHPTYRVVVADARAPRDGRIIERIGRYDPHPDPSVIEIDNERARYWLGTGALPTDRVRKLFEISGAVKRPKVSRSGVYLLEDDLDDPVDDDPTPATDQAVRTDAETAGAPDAEAAQTAESPESPEGPEDSVDTESSASPEGSEGSQGAEVQAQEDTDSKAEGGEI